MYSCIDVFVFFILSVPRSGENRSKWIEVIGKHQPFDNNRKMFNVCALHFCVGDFSGNGDKRALNANAVPSIFARRMNADSTYDQVTDNTVPAKNQCVQCPLLLQKIVNLEKEIFTLNVQHNVRLQKLQLQFDSLKNKNAQRIEQVKQFRKDLANEKKETIQLKDVIDDLKSQNFISTEDEKLLNV